MEIRKEVSIINNIKKLRTEKGLTLRDLSTLINVSAGYLSDLENNRKENPSYKVIVKIANALGISIENLFINKEENEHDEAFN